MMWKTKFTQLLNIDYPIIQGAMAYISDGKLAAAMSHAGCAGVIASGGFSPDEVRNEIRRFKDIAGPNKVLALILCYKIEIKTTSRKLHVTKKFRLLLLAPGIPFLG